MVKFLFRLIRLFFLTDFSDNNEKIIASILDKAKDVTNKVCLYTKKIITKELETLTKYLLLKPLVFLLCFYFWVLFFGLLLLELIIHHSYYLIFLAFCRINYIFYFDNLNSPTWVTSLLLMVYIGL